MRFLLLRLKEWTKRNIQNSYMGLYRVMFEDKCDKILRGTSIAPLRFSRLEKGYSFFDINRENPHRRQ